VRIAETVDPFRRVELLLHVAAWLHRRIPSLRSIIE